jgi:hypothetical protein
LSRQWTMLMKCDACGAEVRMYYLNYGSHWCLACVKKHKVRRIAGPFFVRQ